MRLRDVVLKRSLGRHVLHHLASTYQVEVNERACSEIERALADPEDRGPGRRLVERLGARRLVGEGPFEPIPVRKGSDLVSLELEPTGHCNLQCKHCFVQFSHLQMTEAVFETALEGAAALGAVEVTLNGGEPLLHPRALDWLRAIRRAGLRALLFTNATLVTGELAAELALLRVARVTVSLDGFEAEHDALRGEGAFRRTVAGIKALTRAGVSVSTTTVVTPENESRLDALRIFCLQDLGVSGVRTSTVAPMGRAATAPELQLSPERFRALYANEQAASAAPARREHGLLACSAGVNKLYVSARGEVHGCHLFDAVAPPLGDLKTRPLAEVYASIQGTPCGEVLRSFALERLKGCAGCPALEECRGGCRARAWQLTKNRWAPDAVSCQKRGLAPPCEAVAG